MEQREPQDELFERVRAAFNAVDPERFFQYGFPEDEYNPEVREVCRRLRAGEELTPDLIRSVLLTMVKRAEDDDVAQLYALLA